MIYKKIDSLFEKTFNVLAAHKKFGIIH